jgi:hypothetical protein
VPRQTTGTKQERDELRRRMLADGHSYEQVANEMRGLWGFRSRTAWRHAYGWTQREVADRFNQIADDPNASMSSSRISDYENWPLSPSGAKPTITSLNVLAKIYDTSPAMLVDSHDWDKFSQKDRISLDASLKPPSKHDGVVAVHNSNLLRPDARSSILNQPRAASLVSHSLSNEWRSLPVFDMVMSAAYRSQEHSDNARGQAMAEVALDELSVDVTRLVREHMVTDPLTAFPEVVSVRDRIYRSLELRQYPRQVTHLYYLASIMCALLADMSMGLGIQRAALEQVRASWAYAEIIGHNSLRWWAKSFEASLAFWGNRPLRALDIVQSAQEWATQSNSGFHNASALYLAISSRFDEAKVALGNAFDAYETLPANSELFDGIGGLFARPRQRFLQTVTMTYLELGEFDKAAEIAAEALRLYRASSPDSQAFGSQSSLQIDLGKARLLQGDTEGATSALRPVLDLPSARRLDWLGTKIGGFNVTLRQHAGATSASGRELSGEIENFLDDTVVHKFPRENG